MARFLTVLAVVLAFGLAVTDANAQGKKGQKGRMVNPEKIFKTLDKDGNGTLSAEEFKSAIKAQNKKLVKRIAKRVGEEKAQKFAERRMKQALSAWSQIEGSSDGVTFDEFKANFKKLFARGGRKGKNKGNN
ncbi:MAG: hypothetical protein ACFCD0_07560 [Gemmataceae bacterium]